MLAYYTLGHESNQHQCPSGENIFSFFPHIGHEHQQCSLKRAYKCIQLLVSFERRFKSHFFRFELYTQRNINVRFTNILWDSLIKMRNYLDFWKTICQVKYSVFRNLALYIFSIFSITYTYYWLHLKILLTIFLWVVHMLLTTTVTFLLYSLCADVCRSNISNKTKCEKNNISLLNFSQRFFGKNLKSE